MQRDVDIVSFGEPVQEQRSEPLPARLISGNPEVRLWNHFEDPSQQFFAGVWSATRGSWRISYTENEFCHLLEGRIALVSEAGRRWEFAAGDSFVVPAGFTGIWEVLEDCRKVYAIFEPRR